MKILTETNFKQTIETGITVVDFYADWCGPCKALATFISKIEPNYPDVKFTKLDTEEATELTSLYQVKALPTLIFFKDGVEVERNVGFSPVTVENTIRKVIG